MSDKKISDIWRRLKKKIEREGILPEKFSKKRFRMHLSPKMDKFQKQVVPLEKAYYKFQEKKGSEGYSKGTKKRAASLVEKYKKVRAMREELSKILLEYRWQFESSMGYMVSRQGVDPAEHAKLQEILANFDEFNLSLRQYGGKLRGHQAYLELVAGMRKLPEPEKPAGASDAPKGGWKKAIPTGADPKEFGYTTEQYRQADEQAQKVMRAFYGIPEPPPKEPTPPPSLPGADWMLKSFYELSKELEAIHKEARILNGQRDVSSRLGATRYNLNVLERYQKVRLALRMYEQKLNNLMEVRETLPMLAMGLKEDEKRVVNRMNEYVVKLVARHNQISDIMKDVVVFLQEQVPYAQKLLTRHKASAQKLLKAASGAQWAVNYAMLSGMSPGGRQQARGIATKAANLVIELYYGDNSKKEPMTQQVSVKDKANALGCTNKQHNTFCTIAGLCIDRNKAMALIREHIKLTQEMLFAIENINMVA
jgi:hypothetical protein